MTPSVKRSLIILGIILLSFKLIGSYSIIILPIVGLIYYVFRHYDSPYVQAENNILSKLVVMVYLSGLYRNFFNQNSNVARDGRQGNIFIFLIIMTVFVLLTIGGYHGKSFGLELSGGILAITAYGFFVLCFYANKHRIQSGYDQKYATESTRHGTARLATTDEVHSQLNQSEGIYVGGLSFYFPQMTHGLLCAGSGGGKGTKIIIPNLLKIGRFKGSFVVIDPKGENAAITARIQREELGRKVVMLNPWGLHQLPSDSYNPLDLLVHDLNNLADDAEMIAETIIPATQGNQAFWDDKARSILTALILHLVTSNPEPERHLGTIYTWLGLPQDDWFSLLADMSTNDNEFVGEIISGEANRILALMKSEKEYSSVISTLNRHMDFIKSPSLRNAMKKSEGFSPVDLTKKDTIVYVIIPADKLISHSKWLRLVTSTLMKAVVRNNTIKKEKEVCFLLDEFFSLGYLQIVEIALAQYRGFGVHVLPVLQDLSQLKTHYKGWETFIANCNFKQFFNINDEFTAEYVSKLLGKKSVVSYDNDDIATGSTSRMLMNADEVRANTGLISFIGTMKPTIIKGVPYYDAQFKLKEGVDYDPNPYVTKSEEQTA